MIGQTVYVLKEAQNWKRYCVKMTIWHKNVCRFGRHRMTHYTGRKTGDNSYESSYWQDDRLGRLVRKTPFPDMPAFDNAEDVWAFTSSNRLERM